MPVVGFEALARWIDEDGVVHGPGEFIEAAGEFGPLNDITGFLFEDVVRSLPLLDATYGSARPRGGSREHKRTHPPQP